MRVRVWTSSEAHTKWCELLRGAEDGEVQAIDGRWGMRAAVISPVEFDMLRREGGPLPKAEERNTSESKEGTFALLNAAKDDGRVFRITNAGRDVAYIVGWEPFARYVHDGGRARAMRKAGVRFDDPREPDLQADGRLHCHVCDEPLCVDVAGQPVYLGWRHCPNCGQAINWADNDERKI